MLVKAKSYINLIAGLFNDSTGWFFLKCLLFKGSKHFIFFLLVSICFAVLPFTGFTQKKNFFSPDSIYNPSRVRFVAASTATIYVASLAGLYQLWYRDTNLVNLHSFNDNAEWFQMDKIGHIGSAYYTGKMGISLLNWTGMNRKKAIWYGGLMGAFFQTSIELFDGISPAWGFSWGDITANFLGSALLISQQLAWDEQRVQIKFSFHQTKYSKLRSELLGSSFVENVFKDYNGQTYWLTANISSFLPSTAKFPKWLGISIGYGAEGMTGAFENPLFVKNQSLPMYKRYRQIYLSPDIDLAKIKSKSPFLNSVLYTFGFIKFPLPAIEFQVPGKVRFLPVAF